MSTTQMAPTSSARNDYLDQVVRQQKQVEYDLRARKCAAPMLSNPGASRSAAPEDDGTRVFEPVAGLNRNETPRPRWTGSSWPRRVWTT